MPGEVLPSGARIGPFTVIAVLGAGGQSIVYRAREADGREVALKVLRDEVLRDDRVVARFWREARALAAVTHPNLAAIRFVGDAGEQPYIVMDLFSRGTLADRLRREGKLPWREAVARAAEVARALEALHAAGIVHRDVKPQNVLVDSDGSARLADLGLARYENELPLTLPGEVMGTPAYMAPEQIQGSEVDARADLYSLGATLYALLTGRSPFAEQFGYALLRKQLSEAPAPPRAIEPSVPADVEALVLRLLSKAPAERGASTAAVALELEGLARARARRPGVRGVLLALCALSFGALLVALQGRPRPAPEEPLPAAARTPGAPVVAKPRSAAVAPGGVEELAPLGSRALPVLWHPSEIHALAFSPDGESVLAGDEMGSLLLWDARTGSRIRRVGVVEGVVRAIAWSPAGSRAAIASDDGLSVWDGGAAPPRRVATAHRPEALAFVDERRVLLAGHAVEVFEIDTVSRASRSLVDETAISRARDVSSVALAADFALYGFRDGEVRLFDFAAGDSRVVIERERRASETVPLQRVPSAVAISATGRELAIVRDNMVDIRDRARPELPIAVFHAVDLVLSAAFSPEGERLLLGTKSRGFEVWERASGAAWPPVGEAVKARDTRAAAFSRDGTRLAAGSFDGTLRIADVALRSSVREPSSSAVLALATTPSGLAWGTHVGAAHFIASSGRDSHFIVESAVVAVAVAHGDVHAISRGGVFHSWRARGDEWFAEARPWNRGVQAFVLDQPFVRAACFTRDGSRAFVWDAAGPRALWQQHELPTPLPELKTSIWACTTTAEGLVVCSDRDKLRLVQWPGLDRDVARHKRWTAVAPLDATREILAGDEDGFVWRGPPTTDRVADGSAQDHWVVALAASRDAAYVACATASGAIRVLDGRSLVEVGRIALADGEVALALAFTEQGILLAGTTDGVVRRYSLQVTGR